MSAAGFAPETFAFLTSLKDNNAKDWFDAHKADYQRFVKKPSDFFRSEVARKLAELTGHEIVSKQFRINRDLRFSKDKTPYNTHIRMAFWPNGGAFEGRDAQPPSFFLSVEPDHIRFGTGCMAFSKPVLGSYLQALETGKGEEIERLLDQLNSEGFDRSEPDLAKVPRGFPKDNQFADLARHKGLAVWKSIEDTDQLIDDTAPTFMVSAWNPTLPFWQWLADILKPVYAM
ncbi:uncharacterized protein (TIGR02453 family) [Labrenzia sp. EL_142]|nr:uncharacterized protein (TIGR02453 family) [Labrenzia sp. EL_142]